jgi:hypothetical protein
VRADATADGVFFAAPDPGLFLARAVAGARRFDAAAFAADRFGADFFAEARLAADFFAEDRVAADLFAEDRFAPFAGARLTADLVVELRFGRDCPFDRFAAVRFATVPPRPVTRPQSIVIVAQLAAANLSPEGSVSGHVQESRTAGPTFARSAI